MERERSAQSVDFPDMWKCSSEEFWGWMDYLIFNINMSWEIPVYIEVIWNKRGDKLLLKDSLYVLMQQFLGQYRSIPLFPAHVYSNISLCSGSGLEVICIATLSQFFFLKTPTGEGGIVNQQRYFITTLLVRDSLRASTQWLYCHE